VRVAQISIKNFRGISEGKLALPGHAVLVGDNNSLSGKSSVIEAIDLALSPDRINRAAAIDEHDLYADRYLDANGDPIPIEIEVTIVDLSAEQVRHFKGNLEFWDETTGALVAGPPIAAIEGQNVKEALRVGFRGWYEPDDDDFKARTFFCSPPQDNSEQPPFRTPDKRLCGFLLLRALRTGSRALSLERGSLLDIILRVQELRPKMWPPLRYLAVNRMVNAGSGDAVGFERTHAHGLQQVEERGLAAATNRTGHHQARRHGKALIDECVRDPERHGDELLWRHFDIAPQEMVHEIKRIDGGIGRTMIVPIGPRV
jgi:putative ATP-dependent endonuclease of OLD family